MTIKAYFKNLQIIHASMLSGQVLFFLVLFALRKEVPTNTLSWDTTILLFATLLGVVGGHGIFLRRLSQGRKETALSSKLQHLRAALLIRYGTLEGPFLLCIVFYVFYGIDARYLLINALTIIVFLYYRPSVRLATHLLKLDYTDASSLEDGTLVV